MGRRDTERDGPWDVWRAIIRPPYAAARARHATERAEAYEITRDLMLKRGICGPDLRITDLDPATLQVWHSTWHGAHPSGAGKWNWPSLLEQLPHRAAVLPIAIWYGSDLCGLALGQASKRRGNGSRHTVTLTYIERRPEPPDVALRGKIVLIAVEVALMYGRGVGAQRLRLRNPDHNLLRYYELHGFDVVWKNGIPVYCQREV